MTSDVQRRQAKDSQPQLIRILKSADKSFTIIMLHMPKGQECRQNNEREIFK